MYRKHAEALRKLPFGVRFGPGSSVAFVEEGRIFWFGLNRTPLAAIHYGLVRREKFKEFLRDLEPEGFTKPDERYKDAMHDASKTWREIDG
jgi:hypothetical protein